MMEKIKVYTVTHGGESIVSHNLENAIEQLIGVPHVHMLEPDNGEKEAEITITVSYMSRKEYAELPEYQ